MKKFRKLVPALCMLLVSAVLMGTSTYAWFSMNNKVTVSGMQITTKVSSNLMIVEDTLASTTKKEDSDFTAAPITTEHKAVLAPVSTINGTDFFYTLKAKADGSKESGNYTAYNAETAATATAFGNKFSEDYNITKEQVNAATGAEGSALAYVDYVFQLKAVATEDVYLNLSRLDLINKNAKDASSKAYRVAVFTEDITAGTATGRVGTNQAIFTPAGAENQTAGQAVNAAETTAAVSYNTYADATNNTLAKLTAGKTKYFKVVVRLWLEGEDKTCTNDMFKSLTNAWGLELDLSLDADASTAVNAVAQYRFAEVSGVAYLYNGTTVYTKADMAEVAAPSQDVKNAFGIAD